MSKMAERLILTIEDEVEIETQEEIVEGVGNMQIQTAENGVGNMIGKNK